MKKTLFFFWIAVILINSIRSNAQWIAVLDEVVPVDIVISPDYHHDQTVYMVDASAKIWISETGGTNWTTVYKAEDPNDAKQLVADLTISPNFLNDNAIFMVHKDGSMELSYDRGQHWVAFPCPIGTSALILSPQFSEDYTMHCITGVFGPVKFYKSTNGGASWGNPVADIFLGGGYYSKLWNSTDIAAKDTFAIQYDYSSLYTSMDGGKNWEKSFQADLLFSDFAFSPQVSSDNTMFAADASGIYINTEGGSIQSWFNKANFPGASLIKLAVSPAYETDHTIFAAVVQYGIQYSDNGGLSWNPFNDGFGSLLPISIAISNVSPFTLFAGAMEPESNLGKLWKFQSYSGLNDPVGDAKMEFYNFPNPFSESTEICFEVNEPGNITLKILDLTGNTVASLINGAVDKGFHKFFFENHDDLLKPGVYLCQVLSESHSEVIRMIVR